MSNRSNVRKIAPAMIALVILLAGCQGGGNGEADSHGQEAAHGSASGSAAAPAEVQLGPEAHQP